MCAMLAQTWSCINGYLQNQNLFTPGSALPSRFKQSIRHLPKPQNLWCNNLVKKGWAYFWMRPIHMMWNFTVFWNFNPISDMFWNFTIRDVKFHNKRIEISHISLTFVWYFIVKFQNFMKFHIICETPFTNLNVLW